MSTANAVVTGKIGPGNTITAIPLPNVTNVNFQIDRNVLSITTNGKIVDFDYAVTVTCTYVITTGNAVVTVA